MNRCCWVNLDNPLYINYHDNDWGIPKYDDRMLFELLILESFQAGLSWECVLNKRDNFKQAFDHFDIEKIRYYDDKKCQELAHNCCIIHHIGKSNLFLKMPKFLNKFKMNLDLLAIIFGIEDDEIKKQKLYLF